MGSGSQVNENILSLVLGNLCSPVKIISTTLTLNATGIDRHGRIQCLAEFASVRATFSCFDANQQLFGNGGTINYPV